MKVSYVNALCNTKFTSVFKKYPVSRFINPIEITGIRDKLDYEDARLELQRRGAELYKAFGSNKRYYRKYDYFETPNSFVQVYRSMDGCILKEARYSTGNYETYTFDGTGSLKKVSAYNDAKKTVTDFNYPDSFEI